VAGNSTRPNKHCHQGGFAIRNVKTCWQDAQTFRAPAASTTDTGSTPVGHLQLEAL